MDQPSRSAEISPLRFGELSLRPTALGDTRYFRDIDIKCFETPWTPNEWRWASDNCLGCVCTFRQTPIGMVVNYRNEDGDLMVAKLGVKPEYRRVGIGTDLLRSAYHHALYVGAPYLVTIIPEWQICPGQPEDLSGWLKRRGLTAHREIVRNFQFAYGEPIDGIQFSIKVKPLETI